jgi:hypothetical protein
MTVLYMDNPCGYVCRARRSEMLEIPDKEENLQSIIFILAATLNIKVSIFESSKVSHLMYDSIIGIFLIIYHYCRLL